MNLHIVSADILLSLSLSLSFFFLAVGREGHRVRSQEHGGGRAHGGRDACICGECTLIGYLEMLIGCLDERMVVDDVCMRVFVANVRRTCTRVQLYTVIRELCVGCTGRDRAREMGREGW